MNQNEKYNVKEKNLNMGTEIRKKKKKDFDSPNDRVMLIKSAKNNKK